MAMQGNELERQRGDTRYQTTSQTEMQHQVVMEKEIKEPECESIQKERLESPWRQTNWPPAPVTQIQEDIPRKRDNICHFRHGE